MPISTRVKTVLVVVLTAAAIYVGVLNVADRLTWKLPSDGLYWNSTPDGIEVERASEVSGQGPRVGDRLVDIDGISIRDLNDYTEMLEALTRNARETAVADYTFVRESLGQVTYPVTIRGRPQISFLDLPLIAVAIAFLAVGLFVYLRSWSAAGAFHFYFVSLVAFVLLAFRYSGRADTFDLAIYWCSAVTFLLLPPLFLHFCCYFPKPLAFVARTPGLKYVVYLPAALLSWIHIQWFRGLLRPAGLPRTEAGGHFLDHVELTHFLVMVSLAVAALIWTRVSARSPVVKRQVHWVTNGAIAGVAPFAVLYGIPYLLDWQIQAWMEASVLSLGLVPLSFGYAIAKYRLFDVDVIFKKGVAYVIASSAVLAMYVGAALLIAEAFHDLTSESSSLLLAVTALGAAFVFAPLRNLVQEQVDRYFYKDRYGYRRSFYDFARTLGPEIDLSLLTQKISDRIYRTLDVSQVVLFLREDAERDVYHLYNVQESGSHRDWPSSLELPERVVTELGEETLGFSTSGDETSQQAQTLLAEWGVCHVQPMRVRGRTIGFLGLGMRSDGHFLTTEDREMVATFATYAAIAIDNAVLYSSLENKAEELMELKSYSDHVIEGITLGVAVVEPEGEVTVWNSGMVALTGRAVSEAVGRSISELLPREVIASMKDVIEGDGWVVEEAVSLYKTPLRLEDAEGRLVNIILTPFFSHSDINKGTLILFDDVTEKARLESQLVQAEKLSSIGLFAAGLAHEVNTPLAGISSCSQMLLQETGEDDPRFELLKKIERQSFRASEIVNNLLNFARLSGSDFEELDVNTLMSETLSLLEHQLKKSAVDVDLKLDTSLPRTIGNGGKLKQVFVNLFLNAKDAMPKGGTIEVKTYVENSDLVVEIQDSGTGISRQDIKRIYDPFFTTKDVGEGTGLGLSISYGIIKEHSGQIDVESVPGQGTRFRLHLPVRRVS